LKQRKDNSYNKYRQLTKRVNTKKNLLYQFSQLRDFNPEIPYQEVQPDLQIMKNTTRGDDTEYMEMSS